MNVSTLKLVDALVFEASTKTIKERWTRRNIERWKSVIQASEIDIFVVYEYEDHSDPIMEFLMRRSFIRRLYGISGAVKVK